MSKTNASAERVALSVVPKDNIVELIGFKDGKETGIGLKGAVRSRYIQLLPALDLEPRIRLELLFADGREMSYPEKFEVYNLGPESKVVHSSPQSIVPGLRPLRKLIR